MSSKFICRFRCIDAVAGLLMLTVTAMGTVFHCGKDVDMTVAWLPPKYSDDHKETISISQTASIAAGGPAVCFAERSTASKWTAN
jgi:hypothetical protein